MTTSRRLHIGAVALVLLGGCGALGLRVLDAAEPVTVDEAVERFRGDRTPAPSLTPTPGAPTPSATATTNAPRGAATTAVATPAASAPGAPSRPAARASAMPEAPEGVYVNATTGYESGSAGPARSRHDYPDETTTTVRRDGCGTSLRWEPIEGRWDDVLTCRTRGGVQIRVYDTMHTFFNVSERHTYTCSGDSWFRPPTTAPGYRWSFTCDSGRAQTHTAARIVGIEQVGGADALHVRFDTTMTGATEGANPSDYWLALDEPFLLRKTGSVDAQVHTDMGTLTYHEEYDVRLTSRTPRT